MSEKQKLGREPAFGFSAYTDPKEGMGQNLTHAKREGMSKRFYAACAAMQGLYSMASNLDMYRAFEKGAKDAGFNSIAAYIANQSYIAADELLKQENQ